MQLYRVDYDLGVSRMRGSLEAGAAVHRLSRMLVPALTGGKYLLFAESGLDLPMRDLRFAGSYNGATLSTHGIAECLSDARLDLANFLATQIQMQPCSIVIENPLATPSHSYVKNFASPLLTFNDEIYHYILDATSTQQTYQALLESCRAPFLTGVCTMAAKRDGQSVEQFLEDVSKKSLLVFTTALDDEGFLIWFPNSCISTVLGDLEIHGTKP